MLRTGLFLSFILISSAKIDYPPEIYDNENNEEFEFSTAIPSFAADPIWVLKLHSSGVEMKLASIEERMEFEETAGPMIENYLWRQALRNNISRPPVNIESEPVGMDDILRLLNKFLLYSNVEPDLNLSESHEDPSIELFFKSPYALLTVNSDTRQWNYFISPPSTVPAWFYEDHTSTMQSSGNVPIPDEVKQQFYVTLIRYLRVFLKYPM